MTLQTRNTLRGTHAEHLLLPDFYRIYLHARLLDGEDKLLSNAHAVFCVEGLRRLRSYFNEAALNTPVVLTERLSNRVLAVHLAENPSTRIIAVNTRFRIDPDVLAHLLLEEFAHSQQMLDGTDFEAQRHQFAYDERPYEQEAKRIATEILGYNPADFIHYLVRDEPDGVLYDRVAKRQDDIMDRQ